MRHKDYCSMDEIGQCSCGVLRGSMSVEPWTVRERQMLQEIRDAENVLAEGLNYPYDEDYGYAIGDHTVVTLAMEASRELQNVQEVLMGAAEDDAVGECGKCGTLLFSEGDMCACDMFGGE
jgi:hypothetical protein